MKKWYVVNVYAGFENKFVENLREQISKNLMETCFGDMLIPASKKVQLRKGEKVEVDERHFPGYVLVEMDMKDEAWHLVLSIPKVTGFLGSKANLFLLLKRNLRKFLPI